jgi:TRAP-type C4-dicarboxylate transport system permease large subunit
MILLVMIGQVTPPVAIVVFAVKATNPEIQLGAVFKRVTVLWIVEAVVIVLVILVPAIALFLPHLMKGG